MDEKKLKLLTSIFEDISNNNDVIKLYNLVNDCVPSKFSNLTACGLLENTLNKISTSVQQLNDNMESFKNDVEVHKENCVDNECELSNRLASLESINITEEPVRPNVSIN